MDLFHGLLLLLLGCILSFIVMGVIFYAESPEEAKKEVNNPILNFWRSLK
jgi:hypothetical protein